jgi:hypothetical protein
MSTGRKSWNLRSASAPTFADNAYYGHEGVLRRYARVDHARPACGIIQHGWTPGTGIIEPQYLHGPWQKYVWSRGNEQLALEAGGAPVEAIGAPFLYQLRLQPAAPPAGRSLIAFPFHGTEGDPVAATFSKYAQTLRQLERDGFGPITVCMYWLEHADPALREPFEKAGFAVTTLGHRDDNPRFIERFVDLVGQHAFVTSNRIGTAIFYGIAMGRPAFLVGPGMALRSERDPAGERVARWTRALFPELDYAAFDGSLQADYADRELGAEFVLSPADLRAKFLWNDNQLADWFVARAKLGFERHARTSSGRWVRFSRRWLLG